MLLVPTISLANNMIFQSEDHVGIEFNIKDIKDAKKISFEEAVEKRMLSEDISYNEALEIMLKEEEEILQDYAEKIYQLEYFNLSSLADKEKNINEIKSNIDIRSIINYVSVEQRFSYDQNTRYKAQLEAELRIVQDTSTSYIIDRVMGLTSIRIAGLYAYDWDETASDYDIAAGKKSVYMWVKGNFKVEVSGSIGGGIDLPGFEVTGEVGGTVKYISDTIKGSKTYSVN